MITWIVSNAGNIVVGLVLIAIVVFIIFKMISDRRKGKSSCGCGCSDCAMSSYCHKND